MTEKNADVESIFDHAVSIESLERRRLYLDATCGDDTQLRGRVEALLRANQDAGSFLEKPHEGLAATIATGGLDTANGQDLNGVSLDFLTPSDKPGCLGTLGLYEVVEVVGRGGMGLVLRACDTKLNRVVAIKVMARELATSAMAVKRFLREAQAAAAVSHDHVVTIHAIQESHQPPFIVMEFIAGQSLQEKIDRTGALEVKEILRIGMQMARGLAAAHEQGLVHRDIKPANILLENGIERVKITDFGLARAVDDVSITRTGQIAGTPQFMSPEQAQSHAIDARSDLFSFGSVLYMMCTGRPPFRADTPLAMLRRITDDTPRPIQEVNAQIPNWLCEIVDKLLRKNPDERFNSAAEVGDLLAEHLAHIQHPDRSPQPQRLRRYDPQAAPQPESPSPWRFWRRLALLILLMLGISYAAPIFVSREEHGSLMIELNDLSTTVEVAGNTITFKNMDKALRLPTGRYSARVQRGELEFETEEFAVPHGRPVKLRVMLEDKKLTGRIDQHSLGGLFVGQELTPERLFGGHTDSVVQVDITPDGGYAIVASGLPHSDGTLWLWNLETGQRIRQFVGHSGPIVQTQISADGHRVISGGTDHTARVWDVETGEEVRRFDGVNPDLIEGIALTPNGKRALIADRSVVGVFSVDTGEIVHTIDGNPRVSSIAVSPDGRMALFVAFNEVLVWDIESFEQTATLEGHKMGIQSIAVSHNGMRAVTAGVDRTVCLWDLQTRGQIEVFRGHTAGVKSARFSPDDRLIVSCGHDQTIRVWDVATGEEVARGFVAGRSITSVAFTSDGTRVLSGSGLGESVPAPDERTFGLRLWRLPEHLLPWPDSETEATLYTVSDQGLLKRIDIARGCFRTSTIKVLGNAFSDVAGMAMSDDATLYAAAHDENDMVDLYSLDSVSGKSTKIGATGFKAVSGLAWSGGKLWAVTSGPGDDAGQLLSVDTSTGRAKPIGAPLPLDELDSLTFDDRGRLLASIAMGLRDRVYELDVRGASAPRQVAYTESISDISRDIKGLTFAVDGKLYAVTESSPTFQDGPLRSHLVQIDPDTFEYKDLGQLEFGALCLAADRRKPSDAAGPLTTSD